MISKIVHLGDYHIHNQQWHERYEIGNQFIYKTLEEKKPDRIVIVGDLFENFIQISNEAKSFAGKFINKLSEIAPVIIVPGNHDIRKKDLKRKNSVQTVIELINNPKVTYFDKSGFYIDENVVWVNHSHLEKDINPWKDIPHERDKNKIYIDLWHDPVNDCITDNGFKITSKSYRNLSDFKGDFGFFADIHKFQYLNDEKTMAYCSSTFQQTMGEDVEMHGFIIWDIINKTSEFIIVPDEYKLITFRTSENFDYDNINFEHPLATKKSQFRVIWRDFSANINNDNEEKIKRYISAKWNDNIKFEKERIYTKITSSQKLTESIDINDKSIQQEVFKEYLKSNKYSDDFIEEILKIDDIINERLDLQKTINNIEWSIEKIWVNNFKSYDYFELDWKDVKGIIQIGGENQQGKTTILDAITYITHGTTLSTNKLGGAQREKNADNRYINNKRDLDFCEGGMVINVNGEQYTLVRRTERKMSRDRKTITSVSTNIEYYEGPNVDDSKKLRGEVKTQTQQKIDAIIGNFEDFIRMTLTNSENLNYLISLDRATFIDSVIRDAGYDIFEKKLEEFKEYKKELNNERIDINVEETEKEIERLKELLSSYKNEHDTLKKEISIIDEQIKNITVKRDNEIKKLNKIDPDIADIDIDAAKRKINEYDEAIENYILKQKTNLEKLKNLKKEYDKIKYEALLKELKNIDDDILNLKLKISQEENKIEKEKSNIIRVEEKINSLKQKEIDTQKSKIIVINSEIDKISNELVIAIENKKRDIKDLQKTQDFKIKTLQNEIKNIKDKGISIKEQINLLENSDVCPTCGALPEHQKNKTDKIAELKNEIQHLFEKGKDIQTKLNEAKATAEKIQNKLNDLESGIYPTDIKKLEEDIKSKIENKRYEIEKIKSICKEIENNIYDNTPELKSNIESGFRIKLNSEQLIQEHQETIKLIKQEISDKEKTKLKLQDEISDIEKIKEEVRIYETLSQENKEISLKIENIKLTIENAKIKIDKYYEQLKYIEENKVIEKEISKIDEELSSLNDKRAEYTEKTTNITKDAALVKQNIQDLQNKIKKYQEQVKRDEILKEYMKCVHRDGIPTFLLQKSRDIINVELEDMLSNVDFTVFFDEYLNLKMYMKKQPWAVQNLLESSGSERSFGAVALKMALRAINNKSKPNLLMLDEVMMKLKNHMVDKFNEMLLDMKKKIDKILIIEHVHEIPFDVLIEVEKNEEGISSLKIL